MECGEWCNEQLSMLGVRRLRVESASENVQLTGAACPVAKRCR